MLSHKSTQGKYCINTYLTLLVSLLGRINQLQALACADTTITLTTEYLHIALVQLTQCSKQKPCKQHAQL